MKVPLKIKFFMWYSDRKVILTKDNLIKRDWQGCTKCCFCGDEELIEHLFLQCPLAKLLWQTIHIAFNLPPPTSSTNMFGNWLVGMHPKLKSRIRVGICALLWAVWNTHNDCIFNRTKVSNFLQVIFKASSWIHTWSLLHKEEDRAPTVFGCNR